MKDLKLNSHPNDKDAPDQLVAIDDDGTEVFIPNDPRNRHYIEAKEWYEAKKLKPFKFKFENVGDEPAPQREKKIVVGDQN